LKILNYIDTDVVDVENRNYCLELDEDKYNNHLFKLILVEEVKRFSEDEVRTVKDFYNDISLIEFELRFISCDAALSRGTLALCEDYMLKNGIPRDKIKERLDFFSKNYVHYYYAKIIYDSVIKNPSLKYDRTIDNEEIRINTYFRKIKNYIANELDM
jgi:hypothetical protein